MTAENHRDLKAILTLDGFIRHEIAAFKDGKWGYDFNKNLINQEDVSTELTLLQKLNKVLLNPQTGELFIYTPQELTFIRNGKEYAAAKELHRKRFAYQLTEVTAANIEEFVDILTTTLPNGQVVLDLGILSTTTVLIPREDKSHLYRIITSLSNYKELIENGDIKEGDPDYEFYQDQMSIAIDIAKSNFEDGEINKLWEKANDDITKFTELLVDKLTDQYHEMSTYVSLYNTDGTENTDITQPLIKKLKKLKITSDTGTEISVYTHLNRLRGKSDNTRIIPKNVWSFDTTVVHTAVTQQRLKLMKLGLRHFNKGMRMFSSGLIHINDMPATIGNCMAYFTLGSQLIMGLSKELNGDALVGLVLHVEKIVKSDKSEKPKLEAIQEVFSDYDLMINILGISGKKKLKQHEKSMFLLDIARKYSHITGIDVFRPGSIFGESISDPDNGAIRKAIGILGSKIRNDEDLSSFAKAEKLQTLTGRTYRMLKYKNKAGMKFIADFVLTLQTSNKNMLISMIASPITSSPKQAFMQLKTSITQDIGTAQILASEANGYDIYLNPIDENGGPIVQLMLGEYGGLVSYTLAFLAFTTDYIETGGDKKFSIETFEYINTFLCGLQFGIVLATGITRFMIDLSDPISLKKFIVDQCLPLDPNMDEVDYERREQRRHWLLRAPIDALYSLAMLTLGSMIMVGSMALYGTSMGLVMGIFQILISQVTSLVASTLIGTAYALIGKDLVFSGETKPGLDGWTQYMSDMGHGQVWSWATQPLKTFWTQLKGFGAGIRSLFQRGRWYNPNSDSDGDGLMDKQELSINMNHEPADYGFVNLDWYDPDCDLDGIPDGVEVDGLYFNGTDWGYTEDSIDNAVEFERSNPLAWDSDKDLLNDLNENFFGTSPNIADSDFDGLKDGEEVYIYGTDPTIQDTDGDGIDDYMEVNGYSLTVNGIIYGPYKTDPTNADTDNDGISDLLEVVGVDVSYFDSDHYWVTHYESRYVVFSDPTIYDTDSDGLSDFEEIFISFTNPNNTNTDGDAMSDFYEVINSLGTSGTNPVIADSDEDPDGDLLPNYLEYNYGTIAWNTNLDFSTDYDYDGLIDSIDWNPIINDIDADGLIDGREWYDIFNGTSINPETLDIDNDGLPNYLDSDSDNDGLLDGLEYIFGSSQNNNDTDGDGISDFDEVYGKYGFNTDPTSIDSDNDGISDPDEIFGFTFLYRNGTELTVFTYPTKYDSDNDGISDGKEISYPYYFNPTDPTDGLADFDGDLLTNAEEIVLYLTSPYDWDTDNDLMPDGWEQKYDLSARHDSVNRWYFDETNNCTIINGYGLGMLMYGAEGDYDADGLTNYYEYILGTKPNNIDSENDGMPDGWEDTWGTNPLLDDASYDPDNDGYYVNGLYYQFPNGQEFMAGSDPFNADTDSDLLLDGFEYHFGLNPNSAVGNDGTYGDYDNDRVINLHEQTQGTNPNDLQLVDVDNDLVWDDWEIYYFGSISLYNQYSDIDDDDLDNFNEWYNYCNPLSNDTDSDMLSDYEEIFTYGTDPTGDDTDFDGLSDGLEIDQYGTNAINCTDSDYDGISDGDEHHLYGTHPGDPDTDNDLLDDLEEVTLGADGWITDPNSVDTDNDSMDDYWEINNGLNPTLDDASNDDDNDLLPNSLEYLCNSDPQNNDTDTDGMIDGWEVQYGLNPISAFGDNGALGDVDYDQLSNLNEYLIGTNPTSNDTDQDGISDFEEVTTGNDLFITNPLSADTDNDTLSDFEEITLGADDYFSDPTSIDGDGDNLTDIEEVTLGADGWISDPLLNDTDSDLISDFDESVIFNTNPNSGDTDSDSLNDYQEIFVHDTNPRDANTDNDALEDGEEVYLGADSQITNPKDTFDPQSSVDNLLATQSTYIDRLLLSWDYMPGVSQYEIKYKHSDESEYHYAFTTSIYYTLTNLVAGKEYFIFVKAQSNYNDAWSQSEFELGWTRQLQPSVPTCSLSNYVDITVTYTISDSATDLELWMKIGSGSWTLYNTFSTSGSVTLQDCSENTYHYFKTRQRVAGAVWTDLYWSDYSSEASKLTQSEPEPTPYSVTSFIGLSNQVNCITFVWNAPSNYMSGWYYKIWRKTSTSAYTLIKTTTSTSYNHYPPSTTTTYTYRIACYNNDDVRGSYKYWTGVVSGGGGFMSDDTDKPIMSIDEDSIESNQNSIDNYLSSHVILLWILLYSVIIYLLIGFIENKRKMRLKSYAQT